MEKLGKRTAKDFYTKLGSLGGLAAHKKHGKEFALRLGELSRKARMLDRTKRKLKAWGLPEKGALTAKTDKRNGLTYAVWSVKENGKFRVVWLGRCEKDGMPKINYRFRREIATTKKTAKDRVYQNPI